jgi:outer membrane protein assembly factor BamB
MEGFNSSHTNVSLASGPVAAPGFETIATDVMGSLKRIDDDGSLLLSDQQTVASYTRSGRLKWCTNVISTLNGAVADIAIVLSGTVYVSSATSVIALDSETGLSLWPAPFVANSGNESGVLIVGSDGSN